ncbi:uncharacterized protein LOC144660307 [Oculina patagonica]
MAREATDVITTSKNEKEKLVNAKMLFDEAEVFDGLSAWFSASVPARLKSQWVKNGGIHSNDFNNADYIFSCDAAVKDTIRIFDSQMYQKEELTIFHSSLIEDTVRNGKRCLSGKHAGAYILIHPAYQKEIECFQKKQCPRLYRSNVKLSRNEDGKESGPDNSTHKDGSIVCHQEPSDYKQSDEWEFNDEKDICTSENPTKLHIEDDEEEHLDEWDFKDDANLNINNLMDARRQTKTIVQCDNSNVLSNSSHLNSDSTSVKRPQVERLSNGKWEETWNLTRKGKSLCCQGERERNSYSGDHSVTLMGHEIEQDLYSGEYQRKSMSHLQGIEERESFLDDTQVKNKVASEAPANSRSEFFSSMDDGFVHIDDIKLPDTFIFDFIPNQNGCRVDAK